MPRDTPISIVVGDDHTMFREGLHQMVELLDDIDIVAEASNGDELIETIVEHNPDVGVVDISMPGPGPASIVKAVEERCPDCRLMALTMHLEPQYASDLLKLGMYGYVVKESTFQELAEAVRSVAAGDQYLSARIVERLQERGDDAAPSGPPKLTDREAECLQGVAGGETSYQIANRLGISRRTVRFHISNVCQKLGVQRQSEAVRRARHIGLIRTMPDDVTR